MKIMKDGLFSFLLSGVQRGALHQRRDGHLPGAVPVARGHRLPPRPQAPHRRHLLPLPPHLPRDGRQAPGKDGQERFLLFTPSALFFEDPKKCLKKC